ncbi:MAG: 6-phosphofructokinase [Hyphomicrobiales bacterium]
MKSIRKIGILTSGGDAPGMNAAIRAVVRTGINNSIEVFGIRNGYDGLIKGNIERMESHSVSDIIQRGGTILKSARSEEFRTPEGMQKAYDNLMIHGINALIVIGGDGTFTGANIFGNKFNFPIVGIPGTIDNDLFGTDMTIGYDTALNTVVEAVDKIRDTAYSHNRLFIVEVMGRDAGFIALNAGIATGAEDILIPEHPMLTGELLDHLKNDWRRNKKSGILIVAEGDTSGGAFEIMKKIKSEVDYFDIRVTILGHIQRGGAPSCYDRVLASTMGYEAVMALLKGEKDIMVGKIHHDIHFTPFNKSIKYHKDLNRTTLELVRTLAG